jgi:glutathione S-transferase/GST-like protein
MRVRVYYFPGPNGWKISIALEEMGLDCEFQIVNILKGEQSHPEFLKINPNGRIPALVDDTSGGERVVIFESGAILQYLGRKSGLFYPPAEAARAWIDAWLFWQAAALGPMTGQITIFKRAAAKPGRDPREVSYAIHRYEKETRRLYDILEKQLNAREFICDQYSIADMACWPWVHRYHHYLGELQQFPNIHAWWQRIGARPAVQRALERGMADLRDQS